MGPLTQAFAVIALVPAAANPSLMLRGEALLMTLCSGASISVPLGNPLPGTQGAACCAKGCHSTDKKRKGAADGSGLPGEPDGE
ncbi:hypothetical protein [Erythrobacter sp. SG61-1L]|uniref:hypothetical protein n=1 Tax=Erythrobacter sp. SG61-1L TaxID=1603897 RepID=UPI0006C911C4|nr:hypothetical protein [Erythrobacter sp. SG61-1L]